MGKVAHENNSKLMQCPRGLVRLAETASSMTCRPRKDAGRDQLERQVPGGGTTTPSTAMKEGGPHTVRPAGFHAELETQISRQHLPSFKC